MSVEMNMDRIRKWKCVFCGSKEKRKLDTVTKDGKINGYSLMCCNCGHIDSFALDSSAIPMFVCGQSANVKEIKVSCALSNDEIQFCKNSNCVYRPGYKQSTTGSPSIKSDNTKNDMVIERKYQ